MKSTLKIISYLGLIGILLISQSCKPKAAEPEGFTFAFLTDIHVQPEKNADKGLLQAIDKVNELNPDFVITGGDLVMDALGQTRGRADSLYTLYKELSANFKMPVHNTVGNHELFGFYRRNDIERTDPDYGDGMFKRYFGDPYYSFDHEGWHFIVLKSIEEKADRNYQGGVDSVQLVWLKNDLAKVKDETPIVVSVHIPLVSAFNQASQGGMSANDAGSVISNGKDVLALFANKNLKLVLQGHLHVLEDIYLAGRVHFITGGAVSSNWWNGPKGNLEEGFLLIKTKGEEISSEYIDFGWDASANQ